MNVLNTRRKSNKQEKKVAKEVEGRTVIGSGSLWASKGDVRSKEFLIECKTTEKDFYSLSVTTWRKIEKEALKDGIRTPVMSIDLLDGKHRVAVFKCGAIPVDRSRLNKIFTDNKSFRVRPLEYSVISFDKCKNKVGIPLVLVAIPWEDFLDATVR